MATLAMLNRVTTEWVSADYLRNRLSCSKQQLRRDIESMQNDKLLACELLLDIRNEGVGVSDEDAKSPRTSRTVIVKLTGRGRRLADNLPPWATKL